MTLPRIGRLLYPAAAGEWTGQEWSMKMGAVVASVLFGLTLAPMASKADDEQAGRKACMMDALTVCAKFIPDRERITNCLKANSERISEPCRLILVNAH